MSEPEIAAGTPGVGEDDPPAPAAPAPAAVFAGRLRAKPDDTTADDTMADGGPHAGVRTRATRRAIPLPSAGVLRGLIDAPETEPMEWTRHPASGERLFRVPVKLPAGWRGVAAAAAADAADAADAVAAEPVVLPPLTAETVLHEFARIAFADPLPPGLPATWKAGNRLAVTLRDKQNALVHIGRHLGLFSGRRPTGRPYAELSDAELKARSDDIIGALATMGVEVRIADDDAGGAGGGNDPP